MGPYQAEPFRLPTSIPLDPFLRQTGDELQLLPLEKVMVFLFWRPADGMQVAPLRHYVGPFRAHFNDSQIRTCASFSPYLTKMEDGAAESLIIALSKELWSLKLPLLFDRQPKC